MCNPQKSGASRVCITFLQITRKILTFYEYPAIQFQKNNHSAFLILQKICKKILDIFWTFKSILQRIHAAAYIHCSFLTLINVFYMFSTIQPSLSLLFSHFVFLFSPSFSYSSRHETHSTIYNVWFNFITACPLFYGDKKITSQFTTKEQVSR